VCTTEEQPSGVRFLLEKGLSAKDVHKEMFPVYGGEGVCRVKLFKTGYKISLMMKGLKRRYGSGSDDSQKTSMLRVSTHC
jgi:hypothetical protein